MDLMQETGNTVENKKNKDAENLIKRGDDYRNKDDNRRDKNYEEAARCYEKAIEYCEKDKDTEENQVDNFYCWGLALLRLAKIRQDETFEKKFTNFIEASEDIKDANILLNKGVLYFVLERIDIENKSAIECFKKSEKSILRILTFLEKDDEEKILKTNILHTLLDSESSEEGKFFNKITQKLKPEQKTGYKEAYIRSIYIISRLYVKNSNEENVAQYREKEISLKMLFPDDDNNLSKFRLNAVDYSNDPTEGKVLLDFLYGNGNYKTDEELNSEYEAFVGSFVFDYDNLNMFRLYGKDDKKEGTGLSLVFKDTFFNKYADMAIETPKRNKSSLYRCIYIDPNPKTEQHVVTVGQKEEYLFYREKKGGVFTTYYEEMNKITKIVREKMEELKKQINDKKLDPAIVGQLLLNLRYLVKHISFKEEQECRIVRILNLQEDKGIKTDNNYKQMYNEYSPKVSDHIKEIYFGPKAESFELFKSILRNKIKGKDIPCYKSDNPLA